MSEHGWDGGDWPDDLDPDTGDLGPDAPDLGGDLSADPLGGGLEPDFGDAETADLAGFDPAADGPDHSPDVPLDPAGDSTVDTPHTLDGPDATDGADAGGDPADDLTPVGADPDLDTNADGWTDQSFPEPLDLDAPEPVDGFPWTDPATLGAEPLPDPDAGYQGAPEPTELASYAGEEIPPGADPWTALSASEDPATSSLARWWSPEA